MFQGPLLPLPPDIPLNQLLAASCRGAPLGAWVRTRATRPQVCYFYHDKCRLVLASADLGLLLGRCKEIAVRTGERISVLPAETVIHWRALQVATGTPHLPGLQRLRMQFPGMRAAATGLLIPVHLRSPEEVLARCVGEGVQVLASRIVYRGWEEDESRGAIVQEV
jgi:hypothetical protein